MNRRLDRFQSDLRIEQDQLSWGEWFSGFADRIESVSARRECAVDEGSCARPPSRLAADDSDARPGCALSGGWETGGASTGMTHHKGTPAKKVVRPRLRTTLEARKPSLRA